MLPVGGIRQQIVMVTYLNGRFGCLCPVQVSVVPANVPSHTIFRTHFRYTHLPPVKIAEPCYAVQIVMEQKRSQRRKLSCILLFVLYSNKTAGKPLITNKALLAFPYAH